MGVASHWDHAGNLRLNPSHRVKVQDVDIVETLISIVAAEHVQLPADAAHGMTGPCGRLLSADLRL